MFSLAGSTTREAVAPDDYGDVARARAGDIAAFERLYRVHVRRIYALVLRLGGGDAEERVQDVFLRAYEKLGSFRGESAFSTWLHRVAVNVVLEARRAQIRRDARITGGAEDLEGRSSYAVERNPGVAVDLERAISSLPDGARTVLVLFDLEGWTHEEIAKLLDVTPGTSKAQLHRARRLVREVFAS